MKKPQVSCSFPAKVFAFEESKKEGNEMFSRGKLKVFYKGETADHRYFSDKFSEELIKSLPYTPIVSYYDAEKKDFKGHAEHQAIYGIIDPKEKIDFETDDCGVEWAVCSTIYYTERPDEVGEIAKQIEGHSQSLELTDAKYVVNYDERRHFKNIEFTGGKFIGVSVLGIDQKPAFTGSSFFTAVETDEEFTKKMKILKDFVESKNGQKESVSNGGQMKITSYEDFMKLTWGDISSKVNEAICSEYSNEAYTYISDMDNDFAYVVFYSYIDGKQSTYKIAYSISEDGNVTLGAATPVHREWVDVTEVKPQETPKVEEERSVEGQSGENGTDTAQTKVETTEVQIDNNNAEESSAFSEIEDTNEASTSPNAEVVTTSGESQSQSQSSDTSDTSEVSGTEDECENVNLQEENPSTSTLTDSERAEFEALKLQEKISLVESFKNKISASDFENFSVNVNSYESKDELELELFRASKINEEKKAKEQAEKESTNSYNRAVFASLLTTTAKTKGNSDDDDSWVARHR